MIGKKIIYTDAVNSIMNDDVELEKWVNYMLSESMIANSICEQCVAKGIDMNRAMKMIAVEFFMEKLLEDEEKSTFK